MSATPFFGNLIGNRFVVQGLAHVAIGTAECGAQRVRAVTALRPIFADMHITHPTRRDVRLVMVAWGLPNAVAEQHAHVVAAMLRADAELDELRRS